MIRYIVLPFIIVFFLCKLTGPSPPMILSSPTISQTNNGDVVLEVQMTAQPAPTVEWTKDGNLVTPGGHVTTDLTSSNNIYTISMVIAQVSG